MKPIVIIPALNPDEELIQLVKSLNLLDLQVVVVNDGSDSPHDYIFEYLKQETRCDICSHSKNRGKGAALKTGIQYVAYHYPEACGYVTADADGQHRAEDIAEVAEYLEKNQDALILGTRNFHGRNIPFKSYYGNRITSFVYLLSTGKQCEDTQTGLRGISKTHKALCLSVSGEKYEYEMNVLLEFGRKKIPFICIPIETIYKENNASSHFHPFRDSALIYLNIVKYSFSSLVSAIADLSLFTIFAAYVFGASTSGILSATVIARLMSGTLNFTINKFWVFGSKKHSATEAIGYFSLFCVQMMMSWLFVSALSRFPMNLTVIKVLVDTGLFFISYQIQKNFIFTEKEERKLIS